MKTASQSKVTMLMMKMSLLFSNLVPQLEAVGWTLRKKSMCAMMIVLEFKTHWRNSHEAQLSIKCESPIERTLTIHGHHTRFFPCKSLQKLHAYLTQDATQ